MALLQILLLVGLFSTPLLADYGLIPELQKLDVRLGLDFYRTEDNFADDGVREPVLVTNRPARLTDTIFSLGGEYGIADSWSVYLQSEIHGATATDVQNETQLLNGGGFGDLLTGVKWTGSYEPIVTVDLYVKFPTGRSVPIDSLDVVTGTGNLDVGFKVHVGKAEGEGFTYFLSPGMVFRSGGFSTALTGDLLLRYGFSRAYVSAFTGGVVSFSPTTLQDSSFTQHDAPGAAGSFARLNGSPSGAFIGGKLGFRLYEQWALEGTTAISFVGNRYPAYFTVGLGILTTFDFYEPRKKKRTREVPFDSKEEDTFYEGK